MKNSIGERIILLREQFGINQGQLSEEVGMDQSLVSKMERNKHEPSTRFLNAMMLRFAANPEWIMTGEGGMFIAPEEYIARGIELLGANIMCQGFLNVLKDSRFTEFQSFISTDKLNHEYSNEELQEFLQRTAEVWYQGDERIRRALGQFVKGYLESGAKSEKEEDK
jgi:transcriptional regulator with XRE-family HTH domain